jgi:hypothetical protein
MASRLGQVPRKEPAGRSILAKSLAAATASSPPPPGEGLTPWPGTLGGSPRPEQPAKSLSRCGTLSPYSDRRPHALPRHPWRTPSAGAASQNHPQPLRHPLYRLQPKDSRPGQAPWEDPLGRSSLAKSPAAASAPSPRLRPTASRADQPPWEDPIGRSSLAKSAAAATAPPPPTPADGLAPWPGVPEGTHRTEQASQIARSRYRTLSPGYSRRHRTLARRPGGNPSAGAGKPNRPQPLPHPLPRLRPKASRPCLASRREPIDRSRKAKSPAAATAPSLQAPAECLAPWPGFPVGTHRPELPRQIPQQLRHPLPRLQPATSRPGQAPRREHLNRAGSPNRPQPLPDPLSRLQPATSHPGMCPSQGRGASAGATPPVCPPELRAPRRLLRLKPEAPHPGQPPEGTHRTEQPHQTGSSRCGTISPDSSPLPLTRSRPLTGEGPPRSEQLRQSASPSSGHPVVSSVSSPRLGIMASPPEGTHRPEHPRQIARSRRDIFSPDSIRQPTTRAPRRGGGPPGEQLRQCARPSPGHPVVSSVSLPRLRVLASPRGGKPLA